MEPVVVRSKVIELTAASRSFRCKSLCIRSSTPLSKSSILAMWLCYLKRGMKTVARVFVLCFLKFGLVKKINTSLPNPPHCFCVCYVNAPSRTHECTHPRPINSAPSSLLRSRSPLNSSSNAARSRSSLSPLHSPPGSPSPNSIRISYPLRTAIPPTWLYPPKHIPTQILSVNDIPTQVLYKPQGSPTPMLPPCARSSRGSQARVRWYQRERQSRLPAMQGAVHARISL
jgi:hypothetical protein